MIFKIENSTPNPKSALNYNARKEKAGLANVVDFRNLPDASAKTIGAEFQRLCNGSRKADPKNVSFHASLDPGVTDEITKDEALFLIEKLMEELGYAQQPYVVYEHNDIDRKHYHVISSRINDEGYAISSSNERRRAQAVLHQYAESLHYTVGKGSVKQEESLCIEYGARSIGTNVEKASSQQKRKGVRRFNPTGDVMQQMKEIYAEALTYTFKTPAQFSFILDELGLSVSSCYVGDDRYSFSLQGMRKGSKMTPPVSESTLGLPLWEMMDTTIKNTKAEKKVLTREKGRLEGLAKSCFEYSKSYEHFENMMRRNGVSVHISYNQDGGIMGVSFVDHTTKCAFKSSDLDNVLSPGRMMKAWESGKWVKERPKKGVEKKMADRKELADVRTGIAVVTAKSKQKGIALSLPPLKDLQKEGEKFEREERQRAKGGIDLTTGSTDVMEILGLALKRN